LGLLTHHVAALTLREQAELALPSRPALSGSLIGREVVLGQLKAHLLSGSGSLRWALTGLPGVGKTALALELAHDPDIQAHFTDGVLWAGLGRKPHLFDLFAQWGRMLNLSSDEFARLTTLEAWGQTLREAIGMQRLLLILDDAWGIEEALTCLVGGPACRYVLTTRSPALALQFAGAARTTLGELDEAEGLELLSREAPQVVAAEPEEAQRLVHAVGGLPLALTLMGKYVQQHAYAGQPRRLRDALERLAQREQRLHLVQPQAPLDAHPSLPLETPLSLAASIGLSVAALPQDAQEMLGALALFPPKPTSFSEEAALAVSNGTPETLDTLVDSGLVESAELGRYRLHQTIVDYAQLHSDQQEARRRLVTWAVTWIETHQEDILLEQELPLLLEALRLAETEQLQPFLMQGSITLAPFLLARGFYTTAEGLLHQAQAAAQMQEDSGGLITSLFHLSTIAEKRGDYTQAEVLLQDCLSLARQQGVPDQLSTILMELGVLRSLQGDLPQAQSYLEEGLLLAHQAAGTTSQARILVNLGALLADRGQFEEAQRQYQEAWRLAQAAEQPRWICAALEGLAQVAVRRGEYQQGETYARAALALARQYGYRERLCGVLTNLGVLALDQGQFAQAEGYFGESLRWAWELGHPEATCRALLNLSEVRVRLGRLAEAETTLEEAIALAGQLDHRHYRCHGFRLRGEISLQRGHLAGAEAALQEGIVLARASAYQWVLSALLCGWGEVHLARQHGEAAQQAWEEALDLAEQIESQELEATARYGLARMAAQGGNLEQAYQQGQASAELFVALGLYQAAEVKRWLAHLPSQVTRLSQQGPLTSQDVLPS
jgi:tetratricopeptide (TPR) repeat protein